MKTELRLRLLASPSILWKWLVTANPIRPWRDDATLRARFREVSARTLVSPARLFILSQLSQQCLALEGDFAEIGVYKGGTAHLLAESLVGSTKSLHLFDTFTGMPPTNPVLDWHRGGDFHDTSLESVRGYLSEFKQVRLYKGLFPETAGPILEAKFSFVHVDVDIYRSVLDCCEFFYPRMVSAGLMIFDDYGFLTCPGAKSAVDQFFADKPEVPCYLPTGQCLVIRQRP